MRVRAFLVLALLVLPMPLPTSAAQAPQLSDPAGDVQLASGAAAAPLLAGADEADLRALALADTPDDIVWTLQVNDLTRPAYFSLLQILFEVSGRPYRIDVYNSRSQAGDFAYRDARLYDGHEGYELVAELALEVDETAATVTTKLPRAYLVDRMGHAPVVGDVLGEIHVVSRGLLDFGFAAARIEVTDRMPDTGGATYAIATGDVAVGHLRLHSPDAIRMSNGGATTFVYHVAVHNAHETPDEARLAFQDVPEGWDVSIQTPVRLEAGERKELVVLATVPFAHEHGGVDHFSLVATSARDAAARATLRLGVLHTPVPQPAGHHSELYLHTDGMNRGVFQDVFPFYSTSMNTLAKHDGDATSVPPNRFDDGPGWTIPLSPALAMGLDFDLARMGVLEGAIASRTPVDSALAAELLLVDPNGKEVTLAEGAPVDFALAPGEAEKAFSIALTPTEDADYVPYQKGQNLVLRLAFADWEGSFCCVGRGSPELVTQAFRLQLPLNEYHDQVGGSEAVGALKLVANGPLAKAGRPGALLAYAFTLTNLGPETETFVLETAGTSADLGEIVPGGSVTLGAGESRAVTLGVRIPREAADGQVLEVILFARAQRDPTAMALASTTTTVAAKAEALDETDAFLQAKAEAEKDTPAPGLALLLATLAAVVHVRRRR